MTTKEKTEKKGGQKAVNIVGCKDRDCHLHGNLKARGRVFEGKVIKKFPKRITIEFERTLYSREYERYQKSKTKIHARLPMCMENSINVGDYINVQECRPLSKIIHFVVINKIRDAEKTSAGKSLEVEAK